MTNDDYKEILNNAYYIFRNSEISRFVDMPALITSPVFESIVNDLITDKINQAYDSVQFPTGPIQLNG